MFLDFSEKKKSSPRKYSKNIDIIETRIVKVIDIIE